MSMDRNLQIALDALFGPTRLAVVGSVKKGKIAHQILSQLSSGGFRGRLYAVNPKAEQPENITEVTAVGSIGEIDEAPDLVVICAPASAVPRIVEEAGKRGVPFAVIITSGFGEIGHG